MHDRLLLVHNFLNEVINTADEDELPRLSESYKDRLNIDSQESLF